jgi:hypothetical protein
VRIEYLQRGKAAMTTPLFRYNGSLAAELMLLVAGMGRKRTLRKPEKEGRGDAASTRDL